MYKRKTGSLLVSKEGSRSLCYLLKTNPLRGKPVYHPSFGVQSGLVSSSFEGMG